MSMHQYSFDIDPFSKASLKILLNRDINLFSLIFIFLIKVTLNCIVNFKSEIILFNQKSNG